MKTRLGGKEILDGLRNLIKDAEESDSTVDQELVSKDEKGDVNQLSQFVILPTSYLKPGASQPRCIFNEEKLSELAESMRQHGIIQPLIVKRVAENNYEIIAGERRWRAAKLLAMAEVPVIIRDVVNESLVALSLIENIQRDDLNVIEEAKAVESLAKEFNLTHEQIAESIGRSRSSISNLLRLLTLDEQLQSMLLEGRIEMGHARALLGLSHENQLKAAEIIIQKKLSVRETEKLVQKLNHPTVYLEENINPEFAEKEKYWKEKFSEKLSSKIDVFIKNDGKGRVVINFNSPDEIDSLVKGIEQSVNLGETYD